MRELILASTSKPRRELLERLQYPFTIVPPEVDETPLLNETPQELVKRLALAKAQAVANKFPHAIIIGSDQVGMLGNKIQGKPLSYANAVQQLEDASGKCLHFFTAMAVLDNTNHFEKVIVEEFKVYYRKLTSEMIHSYLKIEQPLQCAGSCKIDGLGIALIEKLEGNDFTALIGLPLIQLVTLLETAGLRLFN